MKCSAARPGQAAKRDVEPCKRFYVVKRVYTQDLQPYRFEPERVPNPEDSESQSEQLNDRLEGTFWCTCERC